MHAWHDGSVLHAACRAAAACVPPPPLPRPAAAPPTPPHPPGAAPSRPAPTCGGPHELYGHPNGAGTHGDEVEAGQAEVREEPVRRPRQLTAHQQPRQALLVRRHLYGGGVERRRQAHVSLDDAASYAQGASRSPSHLPTHLPAHPPAAACPPSSHSAGSSGAQHSACAADACTHPPPHVYFLSLIHISQGIVR